MIHVAVSVLSYIGRHNNAQNFFNFCLSRLLKQGDYHLLCNCPSLLWDVLLFSYFVIFEFPSNGKCTTDDKGVSSA